MLIPLMLVFASPTADVPEVYLDCLEELTRYAETTWHDVDYIPDAGYFGDGVSGGNAGIRGSCGIALAYATLVRSGRGDADHLTGRVESALRYAAETHITGTAECVDGKQWGDGWQTALWTGSMAFACMLLEDRLPVDVVDGCKRVLAHEADRLSWIDPPSGYRGDSKAEENAWNSNTPSLAAAWLSDDSRAGEWLRTARTYLANSYSVPDETGLLSDWVTTTTLYPSFACENHGFFHPSYQLVTGMSMGDSWLMAHIADADVGRRLGAFARHNVQPVWDCLAAVQLDSGELAYPSGLDWSLHGFGQIPYLAWLGCHLGDPQAAWAERRLAYWLRERQLVSGDGRFTGESVGKGFYREAVMARRVSMAWWQHQVARAHPVESAPPQRLSHLDDVGVLAYRGPETFASLSYGERYMALIAPTARDATSAREAFIVTPRRPSLLGGGLPGATASKLLDLETDGPAAFDALLEAEHGPLVSSRVRVAAYDDALVVVETADGLLGSQKGEVAFPLGIENHAFTGAERDIEWAGGKRTVEALSGDVIECGHWVSIDDRLAMIAGPGGRLMHVATDDYNRRGAAEDTLGLQVGDLYRPRFCIVLPGGSAEVAARVASSIEWSVADGRATLRFRAPRTGVHSVSLDLPSPTDGKLRVLPLAEIRATSNSANHPCELAIDGDASTFWVCSRDGSEPGHGPTPEHPESLEVTLHRAAAISEVVVIPRSSYGPKQARLLIDGREVWAGGMDHQALKVELDAPIRGEVLQLEITGAYDPRHPEAPRNVQVAEIVVIGASE